MNIHSLCPSAEALPLHVEPVLLHVEPLPLHVEPMVLQPKHLLESAEPLLPQKRANFLILPLGGELEGVPNSTFFVPEPP